LKDNSTKLQRLHLGIMVIPVAVFRGEFSWYMKGSSVWLSACLNDYSVQSRLGEFLLSAVLTEALGRCRWLKWRKNC